MSFDHLMEKKTEEAIDSEGDSVVPWKIEAESLREKIDTLNARLLGREIEETCKLDENSETMQGMRKIEDSVQKVMEKAFDEFEKDGKTLTKEKIELLASLTIFLDRYRNAKVQLELLKSVKFPTKPLTQ